MNTEMQRRLFTPLVRGLFVCLLGYSGLAGAGAINEAEPNDSVNFNVPAQSIPVPPEGLRISAAIGTSAEDTTDVDLFTFDGTAGDIPSIMILGDVMTDATGCPGDLGFFSTLALYDPDGNVLFQTISDCDTGAQISGVALPKTGKYVVAVGGYPHYWDQGGMALNIDMPSPGGDYQLVISGFTNPAPAPTPTPPPAPSVKHVPIAVRHWHQDERDLEKRRGLDPITVVILSMKDFDATTVDPNSLTFGAAGHEKSLFRCRKNGIDINRDGLIDMVCYFKPDVANFQTGHLNGVLKGKTKSGQQIEGRGALKIFSVPTRKYRSRHHHPQDGDKRK